MNVNKTLPRLCTFVPESLQIDFFSPRWWLFNGAFTTSEASIALGSFVFRHASSPCVHLPVTA